MAICGRCGTIMPAMPGAKCPACGAASDAPPPATHTTVEQPTETAAAPRPVPTAIDKVALGYNLVIYAALALLAAVILESLHTSVAGGFNLLSFVLALAGVVMMATGLGWSIAVRILLAVLMFIPIVNLVTALAMVVKSTRVLKAAGWRIGFLVVKP